MADLARIKRNVAKMASMSAPEEDIDGYIASEGVTIEDVRNFRAPARGHDVPEYVPPGVEGYDPETGMVTREPRSKLASAAHGAADIATLGFGDEASAAIATGIDMLPGGQGRGYSENLSDIRRLQSDAQEDNPGSFLAGQVAGALAGGGALAKSGLSLSANAIRGGAGLGRTAVASGIEGAALGGAHGFGSGEGLEDRAFNAGLGALGGGVTGLGAPYAIAGASAAGRAVAAPLLARIRPESYARTALSEGIRRSGMLPDDVAAALERARADGQDMFMVADALGHSGQRMLSTIARNPNEMRQTVADTLLHRQMGQGDRLSSFLADGFGAADTAAQRTAALTSARDAASDAAFGAARRDAAPVDVSAAIARIDDTLQPGATRIMGPQNNMANDTVESALSRARALLSDGRSNLTDFNSVYRARQDIADWVTAAERVGRGNQARLLKQVRNDLDNALAEASPTYRSAMRGHQQASRVIDAVDDGIHSASGRVRSADSIQRFNAMAPEEQAAFRAGYADPLIARVEATAAAPGTNKARPLITPKTGDEFPAFAVPGQADQLGRRVAREQRMFETANTALGGSKTADNLADAAEMSKFDPGVMANLFSGRPLRAALDAVAKLASEAKGMPPSVMERLAKTLLETNPEAARAMIRQAGSQAARKDGRRALANAILLNMSASGTGRLAAP